MKSFRMAPTPSGFLHRGNALNFVLVWMRARQSGAKLHLRIDDHDYPRKRREYVDDIFKTLRWLGLDWDSGPEGSDDFEKNFSQTLKFDYYWEEVCRLKETFACQCSRKSLSLNEGIHSQEFCERPVEFIENKTSLRLDTSSMSLPNEQFIDCILWRKDNIPSYQIVSMIEDRDNGTTTLVRGEDLKDSSLFQKEFARHLGWDFPEEIIHHSLILREGEKISKTQKSPGVREEFSRPQDFYLEIVSQFLKKPISCAADLLEK